MAEMQQFSSQQSGKYRIAKKSSNGKVYIDYHDSESMRRLLTPNGKIHSRKRTGLSSGEQRMAAQAIKRARYMALMPYTSATL
jgi:small subunit ribosomal protein S18